MSDEHLSERERRATVVGEFELVSGPECPECGCEDSAVIRLVTHWGHQSERRQCRHCGHVFTAPGEEVDE